jgi:hypothetical protein
MSGYQFNIVIEVSNNPALEEIVIAFEVFIKKYLKAKDIKIHKVTTVKENDNIEVILYDEDYPFMSFCLFYEKNNNQIKYISIVDCDSTSTEILAKSDFFDALINDLILNITVNKAILVFDLVFKTCADLFSQTSAKDLELRKYYPSTLYPENNTGLIL